MYSHMFERMTVIGLGLIGSSIARAAHEHKIAAHIVGCDRNEVSLAYGRKQGFIDSAVQNPEIAVKDAEMVILAAPPAALGELARAIGPHLAKGSIVMDVCSVKQAAIAAIAPHIPEGVDFMPAHPIAGSEHAGVSAGRANLFEKKRIIVTPKELQDNILQVVTSFWQQLGAKVEGMPAHLHDQIYAYVSHLPQLLAFAAATPLAPYAAEAESNPSLKKFLRLSGSPADMWTEIFELNKENIISALDRYLDAISHIREELKKAPPDAAGKEDDRLARTRLFPRIAASCLITTVMETEKKSGFSFARYAGSGFADFTIPAADEPEGDLERISSQYNSVARAIDEYTARLKSLRAAIVTGDERKLEKAIGQR